MEKEVLEYMLIQWSLCLLENSRGNKKEEKFCSWFSGILGTIKDIDKGKKVSQKDVNLRHF